MRSNKGEYDRLGMRTRAADSCCGGSPYLSLERIEKISIGLDDGDALELSTKSLCRLLGVRFGSRSTLTDLQHDRPVLRRGSGEVS
jgi:hypothetical protein